MQSFGSHVATDKTNVVARHIACLIQFQFQVIGIHAMPSDNRLMPLDPMVVPCRGLFL